MNAAKTPAPPGRPLSRRAFLRGALALSGLAAIGAACAPVLPATGALQPAPTPAHYTRPSKLGLTVIRFSPQVMDVIAAGQPAVVKIVDDLEPAGTVRQKSPQTLIVGRVSPKYDFYRWLKRKGNSASRAARNFVNEYAELYQANPDVDCWEGFNELIVDDTAAMQACARFEAERVRKMAELGLRCCIGNFATGTPALELWSEFFPALQAAREHSAYLGLHEYSAPVMQFGYGPNQADPAADAGDEGWLTVRYRKVYRHSLPPELRPPLVITECGVDGLVSPRPGPPGSGWRDFKDYWVQSHLAPDGETAYLNQLAWYDQELQKDDYVLGAAIFAFGVVDSDHSGYEMLGAMAGRLQEYLAAHPQGA